MLNYSFNLYLIVKINKKLNEMYEVRFKMLIIFIKRSMFYNCKSMVILLIMKFLLVFKVVRYLIVFVMFR